MFLDTNKLVHRGSAIEGTKIFYEIEIISICEELLDNQVMEMDT